MESSGIRKTLPRNRFYFATLLNHKRDNFEKLRKLSENIITTKVHEIAIL